MSKPHTPRYKTLNQPSYTESLKRRGSLTIWCDPALAWTAHPTGKRGRQPVYSDAAVQTCLTMKILFGMAQGLCLTKLRAIVTRMTRKTDGLP